MEKRTICVERSVNGEMQTLSLDPQHHYKEWSGCFSILLDYQEELDRIALDRYQSEQDWEDYR